MRDHALFLRLEPTRPAGDAQRGFAAELADPAWMLGRQWQMGEHQGENASSPLEVQLVTRDVAIERLPSRPDADPRQVPAEAIVEAGPDDWWTIGRRIRLGMAARRSGGIILGPNGDAPMRFDTLTGPYEPLNGLEWDGLKVHRHQPGHAVFAEVPLPPPDLWRTDLLAYQAQFPCGGSRLTVGGVDDPDRGLWGGHDGGDVDWWSVDADSAIAPSPGAPSPPPQRRWPERFRWPGAPAARWWQIENHRVDLGGLPPDRAHLGTTLLLELLAGHSDDWFLVPVRSRAGHVLDVEAVTITDSFGDPWPQAAAGWRPGGDWSMFRVDGLPLHQLPIWPVAAAPLTGDPIDEITIGIDEDANLAWAVEERLDGRSTDRQRPEGPPERVVEDGEIAPDARYRYLPVSAVPAHWHPYERREVAGSVRFVQGRLVSLDRDGNAKLNVPPASPFLQPRGPGVHDIAPWRLPPTGTRLQSRTVLARDTSGKAVLWVQRRRAPVLSVPSSGLRFDRLVPTGEGP